MFAYAFAQYRYFSRSLASVILTGALTALVLLVFAASPVLAEATLSDGRPDVRNNPAVLFFTPTCNATLIGRIDGPGEDGTGGDAGKIAEDLKLFMAQVEAEGGLPKNGEYLALCLFSGGGDLSEAIKIASLFNGWMMVIEDKAECKSACSIIFMSAAPRDRVFIYSNNSPGRFLHFGGTLAFHSPDLEFPIAEACRMAASGPNAEKCLITPEQAAELAQKTYSDAIGSLRHVAFPSSADIDVSGWYGLQKDSGVEEKIAPDSGTGTKPKESLLTRYIFSPTSAMPHQLLLAFMTVPPKDFYEIDQLEEALAWGIEIYGVAPPPVLTGPMLAQACINVAAQRCARSPDGACLQREKDVYDSGISMAQKFLAEIEARKLEMDKCTANPDLSPDGCMSLIQETTKNWQKTVQKIAKLRNVVSDFGTYAVSFAAGKRAYDSGQFASYEYNKATGADAESVVQTFHMASQFAEPVCDIAAGWTPDASGEFVLQELRIDVADNELGAERPLLQLKEVGPQAMNSGRLTRDYLRPWRMLPAGAKLKDLGGPKPWGWLADGENFFDKPANWTQN